MRTKTKKKVEGRTDAFVTYQKSFSMDECMSDGLVLSRFLESRNLRRLRLMYKNASQDWLQQ